MSQLNIDNIANQLGTGGPDFVGMPSVGGDPIVESGSNTDGQWTRFADGTQTCTSPLLNINIDVSSGNIFRSLPGVTWTFPIVFSAAPQSTASINSGSNTWANAATITATTTKVDLFGMATLSETGNNVSGIAIGRWK